MSPSRPELDPPTFRRRLLRWFGARQRDLPWRGTRDPWAILVSEVMLQQTTVSAVVPYYERFLARWPTASDLAVAEEDELLAAWQGLGYYRRARLLAATARAIHERDGCWPREADELRELPGVGEYTAAAVASIAHDRPVATVDGNVERVICRLTAFADDPRKAAGKRVVREHAAALLARRRPGDFNQAMMELGATVCRPRAPDCPSCPVSAHCRAHAEGDPLRYPSLPARPAPTPVARVAALLVRGSKVLLTRRASPPNEGFLELPQADVPAERLDAQGSPRDAEAEVRALLDGLGLAAGPLRPCAVHRHAITRYRIAVSPWRGSVSSGRVSAPARWVSPREVDLPITTASRKILSAAVPELFEEASP